MFIYGYGSLLLSTRLCQAIVFYILHICTLCMYDKTLPGYGLFFCVENKNSSNWSKDLLSEQNQYMMSLCQFIYICTYNMYIYVWEVHGRWDFKGSGEEGLVTTWTLIYKFRFSSNFFLSVSWRTQKLSLKIRKGVKKSPNSRRPR